MTGSQCFSNWGALNRQKHSATVPMFRPGDNVSADAPDRFVEQQEALIRLIGKAEGVGLRATVVRFPFTRLLRLRLGEALTLLVHHQHRHLRQIQAVIQQGDFPAVGAEVEDEEQPSITGE